MSVQARGPSGRTTNRGGHGVVEEDPEMDEPTRPGGKDKDASREDELRSSERIAGGSEPVRGF